MKCPKQPALVCTIDAIRPSACLMVAFSGFYESHKPPPSGSVHGIVPAHRDGHQNGRQSGHMPACDHQRSRCRPLSPIKCLPPPPPPPPPLPPGRHNRHRHHRGRTHHHWRRKKQQHHHHQHTSCRTIVFMSPDNLDLFNLQYLMFSNYQVVSIKNTLLFSRSTYL